MSKNSKWVIIFIMFIIILVLFAIGGFTNYKQETLVCKKSENICLIERTNFYGMQSEKSLVKISEISDVSFFKLKVKGNRYANGYQEYLLSFVLKDNDKVQIFSKSYYDKKELDQMIAQIQAKFESQDDVIMIDRD